MGKPRPRSPRGTGHELRDDLIRAAAAIHDQSGSTDDITIRQVAEACGVSQGAIYLHFSSRDEMIYDLARDRFNAHYDERIEQMSDVTDPLERISRYGDAYFDFALDNRRLFHALMMGDGNEKNPTRYDGVELIENTRLAGMVDEVRAAMDAGAIASGIPELVACMLWMAIHGAVALIISLPGYPFPSADFIRQVMDEFIANAIKHPLGNDLIAAAMTDRSE